VRSEISNAEETNCCLTEQTTGLQNFVHENNIFRKYLVPDSTSNLLLPKSDPCSVLHSDGRHTG